MSSTAPTVKAALVALFQADAGLSGVAVTYGPPPAATLGAKEYVWVGNIVHVQQAAALGRLRRSDEYTVDVVCDVRDQERADHQALTERAYALAAVVETAVRDWDPSTAAAGAILVEVVEMTLDEGFLPDSSNRASRVTVRLRATTRI